MFHLFKKTSLVLHITDNFVQAMELSGNIENLQLRGYGYQELSPGIVEHGIILEEKTLGEVIKNTLKQAKPKALKPRNAM